VAAAVVALAACSSSPADEVATTTTTTERPTTSTTIATTTTTTVDLTVRPAAPATAKEAGLAYAAAYAVIHEPTIPDDDPRVLRQAHVQQVVVRAIADHPAWDAELPGYLSPTAEAAASAEVAAARDLRSLVRTPKPELPAWTIVEPAPAGELRGYYQDGERQFGIPWEYLAAVHLTETKMGRLRGTSTAGAQGPMQFLPSTWAAYGGGGDVESNHDAILGAARYLAANGGRRGDMHDALYRYNPTEKYVRAVTRYAERMQADPAAYRGYWGWQVYYWSTLGDVWLRPGFSLQQPRPVTAADLR
jgi:hypothetical protein